MNLLIMFLRSASSAKCKSHFGDWKGFFQSWTHSIWFLTRSFLEILRLQTNIQSLFFLVDHFIMFQSRFECKRKGFFVSWTGVKCLSKPCFDVTLLPHKSEVWKSGGTHLLGKGIVAMCWAKSDGHIHIDRIGLTSPYPWLRRPCISKALCVDNKPSGM